MNKLFKYLSLDEKHNSILEKCLRVYYYTSISRVKFHEIS